MNYTEANEQLQGQCKQSRKLMHNTYLQRREEDCIAIKYHATDILTFRPDGSTLLDCEGWHTSTTALRLNEYLPHGWHVGCRGGIWYWFHKPFRWRKNKSYYMEEFYPVTDGDVINPDGKIDPISFGAAKKERLRQKVKDYARLYGKAIPMDPAKAGGDCLYCQMKLVDSGKPMGDRNADHLLSHIEEKYVMANLLKNALDDRGAGQYWYWVAFDPKFRQDDGAREEIARIVRRYMFSQLGNLVA